jgi:WD40 repeat protein
VWSVAFSPGGEQVASGGWDDAVRLWDTQTGANTRILRHRGSVFHVAFSPDGLHLAAATLTAERAAAVVLWDVTTGKELFTVHEKAFPFCVTFDPTGRYLLREGAGFRVKVWDLQAREEAGMLGQHTFNIWGMTFSRDGRRLATGSSDGFVKLWRWDPSQFHQPQQPELVIPSSVTGYGERAAFTPDGQRLIAASKENTVKIWDANTGKELEMLRGHTGEVWAVAMDQESRWLATAGEDTTIRIWDATSWKPLRTLRGHMGVVMSLSFSPDGRYLVSGSRDHTVKFWETARWDNSADR